MQYECPSCFLKWKDEKYPDDLICHPLCSFCSISHTQKELINWQMNHLEDINPDKLPNILRHFYRFVDLELKILNEKIDKNKE
jgi:hypothetical protein